MESGCRIGDGSRVGGRVVLEHGVTIGDSYRAWMHEPELLASYLTIEGLPEDLKGDIRRKLRLDG